MAQWLSYPSFAGPFSGQEQLLAASSTSPGAGMIRIPWSVVAASFGTSTVVGGPFLPLSGGTLTGPLTLSGNATLPLQAVPLQQLSSIVGGPYLPLAGGTLTGPLVLSGNATLPLQAVPLQQLSGIIGGPYLPLAGGTVTGDTTFSGAGTSLTVTNNLTAGGINSTPIGATTPSAGAFTNLTATGTVVLPTTTTGPFLPLYAGVHSIAESGAVGDGVTDDQPVIQTWLNAFGAAAAEVVLEPGKFYYIGGAPLTIPPGIIVRGTYGALDNQLAIPGTFFNGGGFFINPSLPVGIIMSAASALKSLKVYRSGLVANAGTVAATAAYAAWASEAGYYQTNAAMLAGATVIPLSNTAGISVGMQVSGPGPIAPGGSCTVVSIVPNTSVTISSPVVPAVSSGAYYRFGPSIGISIPISTGGVILKELTVIGFRTGIQVIPGQYNISYIHGDCITNIEWFGGGDTGVCNNCEFLPLYGNTTGNSPRAGDAIFIHDGGITVNCYNMFSIGWLTGWHIAHAAGVICVACGNEAFNGAGTVNWWMEGGSQWTLDNCHAQAAGTGFLIQDSNLFTLCNCSSAGGPTVSGNNVAHFYVLSTTSQQMYGQIISPFTDGNYPQKVPILFSGANVISCAVSNPFIYDMTTASPSIPFIQGTVPYSLSPQFVQGTVYQSLSSGDNLRIVEYWSGVIIDSAGTLATLTITLPLYPMDKQVVNLWFNVRVNSITYATGDSTLVGDYGNPVEGDFIKAVYDLAQTTWYIGGAGNTVNLGSAYDSGQTSFASHISLYGSAYGIGVTFQHLNYVAPAGGVHSFITDGAEQFRVADGRIQMLNSTSNYINFEVAGVGPPTFTAVGVGTKISLYNQLDATHAGISIGVDAFSLWMNVRTTTDMFQWFGGTTLAATLSGTGNLSLVGGLGVFGTAALTTAPTVTGAKLPSDTVMASLLTALSSYGLIINSTT